MFVVFIKLMNFDSVSYKIMCMMEGH